MQGRVLGASDYYYVCTAALGQFFELMGDVAFDVGKISFYTGPPQLLTHVSAQVTAIVAVNKGGDRHGEDGQVRGGRHM
jgi:hypothetical protein